MTRRFVLFLALLLPLQFAWAGAVAYCQHETTPALTQHFGHHEHLHQADVEKAPGQSGADSDCGTCHAAGSPAIFESAGIDASVPATATVVPHALRRMPTALARAPDRPQWLRLA